MNEHNFYLAWQILRRELGETAAFYEKEIKKMIDQSIEVDEWQRRQYQYLAGLYNDIMGHYLNTLSRMDEVIKQVESDKQDQ